MQDEDGANVIFMWHGICIMFWYENCCVISTITCTGIPRYTRSHFTRFRYNAIWGKKAVRKLYTNFAVTVYGGGVTVWRAHQLVTSYQYQCEREC